MRERSLKELFDQVRQVIPDSQDLLTFPPSMPVSQGLARMREKNVSQVPVVVGKNVLGVFSYRSLCDGLSKLTPRIAEPLSLPVEEFLEKLLYAQVSVQLTALIDELDLKDAVLVGSDDHLQGIVTTIDALRYFYRVASPYVLVREIELSTRALIRASVDDESLRECIDRSLKSFYLENKQATPACLEDMTLNDYVMLLRYKDTWAKFRKAFGANSDLVYAKLRPLPDLRNQVFHFKRELTAGEYDQLRDVRDWLMQRVALHEASQEERT